MLYRVFNAKMRQQNQFAVLLVAILISTIICTNSLAADVRACTQVINDPMFRLGPSPLFEYQGLSDAGRIRVNETAQNIQTNRERFDQVVISQQAILRTHMLTMAMGQNHILLGPPGAAKTMSINWLLPQIWTKQVSEWTMPDHIFGGQTEKSRSDGRIEINTAGSALEAEFVLMDEFNNANPSLLGSLLSYLNPGERSYAEGSTVHRALTRSIFSTGNASKEEIRDRFRALLMQSGPAILNRFVFTSSVDNWLTPADQARLDEMQRKIERLKSIAKNGSESQKHEARRQLEGLSSVEINYEVVSELAKHAFIESPLLKSLMISFENDFRAKVAQEVTKSQAEAKSNKDHLPFEPSTEWTERVRTLIPSLIRHSAAIDLLNLPEKYRDELLKNPIVLGSLSLWRINELAIPTTNGISFFDLPNLRMEYNIVATEQGFGRLDVESTIENSPDIRDRQRKQNDFIQQRIFNEVLTSLLEEQRRSLKEISALIATLKGANSVSIDDDFEALIYTLTGPRDIANSLKTGN